MMKFTLLPPEAFFRILYQSNKDSFEKVLRGSAILAENTGWKPVPHDPAKAPN
jgi:hypothetical protein